MLSRKESGAVSRCRRWAPVAALMTISATAGAQTTDDPAAVALPEVRIEGESARGPAQGMVATRSATATRTDTPIIDTPQSISVITRERMDEMNAWNLASALRYTPGVNFEQYGDDARGEYFQIRGFQGDVFLDGMRLPAFNGFNSARLETWGMERVEVLRGSASALYGQTNIGGIVNATSRIPQPGMRNTIALQAGSYDRMQVMGDVGGSLTEDDSLLWRFTGLWRDSGTSIDDVTNDRIYVAPSVRWRPNEVVDLTVLGSYLHDEAGSSAQFLPRVGTIDYSPYGRIPINRNTGEPNYDRFTRDQVTAGYLLSIRPAEDWLIRSSFRYMYYQIDYRSIYPYTQTGNTAGRIAYRGEPITNAATFDNNVEHRLMTGPVEHTLLGGVDYRWQLMQNRAGSAVGPSINLFNPVYGAYVPLPAITSSTNQTQQQLGTYVQDQMRWDRVYFTLTGRYDWSWQDTRNTFTEAVTSLNDSAFTGRVGLLYSFESGISPYISYSTSFLPTAGTDYFGANFEPTTGTQWEVGVKYQPPGSRSFAAVALFDLTQQNVLTSDPQHTNYSIQTGEVRNQGVEVEANVALTDEWRVIAAYTYQEPEVTSSNTGTEGNRPVVTPNHQISAWTDYTFRLAEGVALMIGGGVRYQGNTLASNVTGAIAVTPSYTLYDAMASVTWQNWRLAVNGTNIGNTRYVDSCSGAAGVATSSCGYGAGRTVYATLAYSW